MVEMTAAAGWFFTLALLQGCLAAELLLRRRGPFATLCGLLFALNAGGACGWAVGSITEQSVLALRLIHLFDDPTGLVLVLLGILLFLEKPLDRVKWPAPIVTGLILVLPLVALQVWSALTGAPGASTPFRYATVIAPVYLGYSLVLLALTWQLLRSGRPNAPVSWLLVAFGARVAEFATPYGKLAWNAVASGGWMTGQELEVTGAFAQVGALVGSCAWLAGALPRTSGPTRRQIGLALSTLLAFALLGVVEVRPGLDLGPNTPVVATFTLYFVRPIAFGVGKEPRVLIRAVLWIATLLPAVLGAWVGLHLLLGLPVGSVVPADVIILGSVPILAAAIASTIARLSARLDVRFDDLRSIDRPRVLVRFVHTAQALDGEAFRGVTREDIAAATSIRGKHVGLVARAARQRLREHVSSVGPEDPLIEEFDERSARTRKRYRLTERGMEAATRMLAVD